MIEKIRNCYENELIRLVFAALLFTSGLVFDLLEFYLADSVFYISALLVSGIPVFLSAVRGILRLDFFDEKFLMSIASIGATVIGDMSEGAAVMLFFSLGEIFEHKAVRKSRNSIRALMDIRPDEATVIVDGEEERVDAEDVEVGSEIVIRAGERVPIDSVVISGTADVDTSMITGEPLPRSVSEGSFIESGSIVLNGVLRAKTEKLAEESGAQRILELVENATENKSAEENFITAFSRVYTPIVVSLALLIAVFLPIFFDSITWTESVYRALTFLVISCPCALVISVPMAFFGGIGSAASNGILFKGGNVFSPLAKTDTFVFDKTGTLTTASIRVEKVIPLGMEYEKLCYYAASAEYGSLHPISSAIRSLASDAAIPTVSEEIAGKGIRAAVDGKNVLVGTRSLLCENGVSVSDDAPDGVFVAVDSLFCGVITLADTVRKEAKSSIEKLKKNGVKNLYILSGDKRENVLAVADSVGVDNAYGELLPEDKYSKLKGIINSSCKTAFIGDGINDSPSLALSDVGIAMGGIGSDSAIEAADVVITNDDLSKLPLAKRIAKKTLAIAKENIVFAIGVKALVLILGALGYADMWLAVFADVGVAVIAILNSMRALRIRKI